MFKRDAGAFIGDHEGKWLKGRFHHILEANSLEVGLWTLRDEQLTLIYLI